MLFGSILLCIIITILEIVVPVMGMATTEKTLAIVGLIAAIVCLAFAIFGVVICAKRIKANNQKGKSIAALVFNIINTVEGATLLLLAIISLTATTTVIA